MKDFENLNKYYKLVNEYVDEYLDKWKIHPKKLKTFLKNTKNLSNFLKKKGLENLNLAERILSDIIDDRVCIENDLVMKFESFSLKESVEINKIHQCLLIGINSTNIDHEKILADLLDVSLSEIDLLDPDQHKFTINNCEYIIFTKNEIEIIEDNIKEYCFNTIIQNKISIDLGKSESISFISNDIFDSHSLKSKISLDIKGKIKEVILSILNLNLNADLLESDHFISKIN